jgi:HAMP domain-containing protein
MNFGVSRPYVRAERAHYMMSDSGRKHLAETARFDDSFASHMIRDFFLVLVAVVVIELSVRFALVVYDFHNNQELATQIEAERLASDIKSIMLNSGGPVAARTVYPILKRNLEELGLAIAIEPSEITIASIKAVFDFTPRGLPGAWPDGEHHEVKVPVVAEQFCISCHITAKPGEVLGSVTVRNYLSTHVSQWWHEVQLTGLLGISKIVLHTIVLFFLLKIRIEPVLSLRSTIAELAKGASDLSRRAPIKSRDEFGELARDLNSFLGRITHVIQDLSDVLANVLVVNRRLTQVHDQMGHHFKEIDANMTAASDNALRGQCIDPLLSRRWLDATRMLATTFRKTSREGRLPPGYDLHVERFCETLEEMADQAERLASRYDRLTSDLKNISGGLHEFSHFLEEMAVLEEKMHGIAAQGQTLVNRLTYVDSSGAGAGAECAGAAS